MTNKELRLTLDILKEFNPEQYRIFLLGLRTGLDCPDEENQALREEIRKRLEVIGDYERQKKAPTRT